MSTLQVAVPGGSVHFMVGDWMPSAWPLVYGERKHRTVISFELRLEDPHGRIDAFKKLWSAKTGLESIFLTMDRIMYPPVIINHHPNSAGVVKIKCTIDLNDVPDDKDAETAEINRVVNDLFKAIASRYPAPVADSSTRSHGGSPLFVNDSVRLGTRQR